MTYHAIDCIKDDYSLRMRYMLPQFDLPSTNVKYARWIVITKPFCLHVNEPVVKQLCDQYGKERLVLFDCSDQGQGDYPCVVFAQNCRHDWPKTIIGYIQPMAERLWLGDGGSVPLIRPIRIHKRYSVSFCGDIASHPCRSIGAKILKSTASSFVKTHLDGFNSKEMAHVRLDDDYRESFQTRLAWCPPSRRPMTWRHIEAWADGVPVLTTDFSERLRLPALLTELLSLSWIHDENMDGFENVLEDAIALNREGEASAVMAQNIMQIYSRTFWTFVRNELERQ